MKAIKLFALFLSAFLFSGIFTSVNSNAAQINQAKYTFSSGNLQYEITKPAGKNKAGEVALTGATDKNANSISIPDKVYNSGYTYIVSKISDFAFMGFSSLSEITIPDSVTILGKWVFSGCTALKQLRLPKYLTEMGDSIFYGCKSLEQVNIPVSLSYIPENTFYACESLMSLKLPYGITYIGKQAFAGCSMLESISIPYSVTAIGQAAFKACSRLRYINLSDKLASLPDFMLADCISLKEITLPDDLQYIGTGVFSNCQSLSYINIPDKVKNIGAYAFAGCSSLTGARLGNLLDKITDSCFKDCISLKTISLPDNIAIIENNAFENCASLSSVFFGNRLTDIGDNAFLACASLKCIQLPESLSSIGSQAFAGCSSLAKINLPSGISNIYSDILADTAVISESEKALENGLLILDGCLLNGSLASGALVIPDSVRCIAVGAFKGNINISSVTIPDSVTHIGSNAFYSCSKLESIQLPDSLAVLGEGAFYGCVGLTSVRLPENLTEIQAKTFYNCSGLKSVVFPDKLGKIGEYAFYRCSSLAKVNFPAGLTAIASYAFSECSSLTELKLTKGIKWVGNSAFSSCSSLKSLYASAEVISNRAFAECTSLATVTLTDKVLNLGAYAFYNCSSLKAIGLSSNLTVIEYYAFAGCSNLSTVFIPDSVEYILEGAFDGCKSLKTVLLPKNIFIDENAFSGCDLNFYLNRSISVSMQIPTYAVKDYENSCLYPDVLWQEEEASYYLSGKSSYGTSLDIKLQASTGDSKNIGSLSNASYLIKYKDYIYYLDQSRNLYRMSISDGKKTRLLKKVDILIAIYRDHIYYVANKALNCADTSGKNQKQLTVLSGTSISPYYRSSAIRFYDDSIYYVKSEFNNWLCSIEKINLDGSGHKVLAKGLALKDYNYDIYVAGGRIFYQTDDGLIHSIDENGDYILHGQGKIHGIVNDKLYYSDEDGLWMLSDEETPELVLEATFIPDNGLISDISEDDKSIVLYYPGDDDSERGYLYLVNTQDKSVTVIAEADTIWPARIIGDYLYYHKDYNYENGPVYYLRTRYR